jgi:hypothetical protein
VGGSIEIDQAGLHDGAPYVGRFEALVIQW